MVTIKRHGYIRGLDYNRNTGTVEVEVESFLRMGDPIWRTSVCACLADVQHLQVGQEVTVTIDIAVTERSCSG